MYSYLYYFLSGILIGTCMILPGVSGSVIAIMLGIYDELILLINNNKTIVYKIKKIFPIFLGLVIGIFIFGKILLVFYNKYNYYMICIFVGLILGSIPSLHCEIKKKNDNINIISLIISLIISIVIFLLPEIFNINITNQINTVNLFFGGFLYIAGKIIPGISSSFFLMMLGLYEFLLEIITDPFNITLDKLITLLPFFLGLIIGFYIIIKIINYLLKHYFSETYSGIIGFVIGSVFAIFPKVSFSIKGIYGLILMFISYIFVSKLSKNNKK